MTAGQDAVAAQAEEAASLAAFFLRYKRQAYWFAYQMVGSAEDAMDLTQEAFLRLHRRWPRLESPASALPWLYAVLRNLAIDLLRRRAVQAQAEAAASGDGTAPDPESLAERQQLAQALWRAIRRLPEAQREVLLLRDFHGFRYAEIARITGASPALVASRLHDARERLRRQLARYL